LIFYILSDFIGNFSDKKRIQEEKHMNWLAWIVLGGFAGWIASIITRNNAQMGIIWNIIVGIIGALAGSWILGQLGITNPLTFSIETFLVAIGGAVVLLFLFNLLRVRGRGRR